MQWLRLKPGCHCAWYLGFSNRRFGLFPACLSVPSVVRHDTNLVDPASSHMLVSKIKPCMSQYKLLYGETANGSLKQLSFIWWSIITWITMVILELIHAPRPDYVEGLCLLGTEPTQALPGFLVIHDNRTNRIASLAINHSSF